MRSKEKLKWSKLFLNRIHIIPHLYVIESINDFGYQAQPWRLTIKSHIWRPATDVYEIDDTIVIRMEIAGNAGYKIFRYY
jgi:hypothetical protein